MCNNGSIRLSSSSFEIVRGSSPPVPPNGFVGMLFWDYYLFQLEPHTLAEQKPCSGIMNGNNVKRETEIFCIIQKLKKIIFHRFFFIEYITQHIDRI